MEIYNQSLPLLITAHDQKRLHLGDLQTEHEYDLEKHGLIETAEYHLGEHAAALTQLTRISVAYGTSYNQDTRQATTAACIRFATPDFQAKSSKLRSVSSVYDPVGRIEGTRVRACEDYSDEDVDRVLDMLDAIKHAGFPYFADDMVSMLPAK